MKYYTASAEDLKEPKWGGESFEPKWRGLSSDLDKLVMMYWYDLMTFEEMAENAGTHWWTIKELFKQYDVPRMTI
ncbi:hypothetical protein [Tumebacillus lipolyticus]|uniref:Uncharacterized protein n=1 Tax=Tumebacillus lipolyticus TaxID=1280370 RepID=A0ABW4ZSU6_9BACL